VTITHHTDASQSLVQLQFCNTRAGVLDVSVPSNANLLTPGYYMLFIVDNCGVPSVAIFVHIGPLIKPKEKEFKEFKEIKEKEFKEFKEIKEKDFKEFKEVKEKDLKEFKEIKEKDLKEFKEVKEKDKDIFEGGGLRQPPRIFIQPGLRPDLVRTALGNQPDIRPPVAEDVKIKELSREEGKKAKTLKPKKKAYKQTKNAS